MWACEGLGLGLRGAGRGAQVQELAGRVAFGLKYPSAGLSQGRSWNQSYCHETMKTGYIFQGKDAVEERTQM